ncbi:hypothetical protein E3N88_31425 [Mikania micrantha]|uniref:Uncharacterized protein n=1 Tax=Mikania micrantha TaxID=192012 RepID=A0A5N6MPC7_9ASTR|nr:hypothetical protein E3N88_31425 [Mikania micrantha]
MSQNQTSSEMELTGVMRLGFQGHGLNDCQPFAMGKGGFIGADLVDKGLDDGHWVVFLNYSEGKKKERKVG